MNKFTYQLAWVSAVLIMTVGSVQRSESRVTFSDEVDVCEFEKHTGGPLSPVVKQRTKTAAEHKVLGKRNRRSVSSLSNSDILSTLKANTTGTAYSPSNFSRTYVPTYVPPYEPQDENLITVLNPFNVSQLLTYGFFSEPSVDESYKVGARVLKILKHLDETLGIHSLQFTPIISARSLKKPTICRRYKVVDENGKTVRIRLAKTDPARQLRRLIRKAARTPDEQNYVSFGTRFMGQKYECAINLYWGSNFKDLKKGRVFLILNNLTFSGSVDFAIEHNGEIVGSLTASLID